MNRRDRRHHSKCGDGIETIELTPTHALVLRALMEATEGVKGDTYHEAQLAHDLGMNVEDVRRYLHELTFWGFVEEAAGSLDAGGAGHVPPSTAERRAPCGRSALSCMGGGSSPQ